ATTWRPAPTTERSGRRTRRSTRRWTGRHRTTSRPRRTRRPGRARCRRRRRRAERNGTWELLGALRPTQMPTLTHARRPRQRDLTPLPRKISPSRENGGPPGAPAACERSVAEVELLGA